MIGDNMPQHDTRVELDEKVSDAWDLPAARITLATHENDLRMGSFLVDRHADILEAAGATKIYRVYTERATGTSSHQHGTTRMGNDPNSSVLNKYCQAHEVDNLFVVDGAPFPTGTGHNPTLTIKTNAGGVADHIADTRGNDSKG